MMAAQKWTCESIGVHKEGDYYETEDNEWQGKNVKNSSKDRVSPGKYWESKAKKEKGPDITLTKQDCGIWGCNKKAREGGHIWLRRRGQSKRLFRFCFIMPICGTCNRTGENGKKFLGINKNVRLVARPKENME